MTEDSFRFVDETKQTQDTYSYLKPIGIRKLRKQINTKEFKKNYFVIDTRKESPMVVHYECKNVRQDGTSGDANPISPTSKQSKRSRRTMSMPDCLSGFDCPSKYMSIMEYDELRTGKKLPGVSNQAPSVDYQQLNPNEMTLQDFYFDTVSKHMSMGGLQQQLGNEFFFFNQSAFQDPYQEASAQQEHENSMGQHVTNSCPTYESTCMELLTTDTPQPSFPFTPMQFPDESMLSASNEFSLEDDGVMEENYEYQTDQLLDEQRVVDSSQHYHDQ